MRVIRPTLDRVLVREVPVTSAGKIELSPTGEGAMLHGIVLELGQGRIMSDGTYLPIKSVKVGDKVIFGNFRSNVKDYVNGEILTLVQEHAIVGIIEGDEDLIQVATPKILMPEDM